MTEEKRQPQEEGTQQAEQPGEQEPQAIVQTEEEQPGAEQEPQKSERTYTQAEWSERESKLGTQVSDLQKQLNQFQMQKQIEALEQSERSASEQDQQRVNEGLMTQAEASQKKEQRQEERQQQQDIMQKMQTAQGIITQAEQMGRVLAAQDFGKKYQLNEGQIAELLNDKDVKSPEAMEAKAANLALEKTQGELKKAKEPPQTFDQGQLGTSGKSFADMTPTEKVMAGLAQKTKKSK